MGNPKKHARSRDENVRRAKKAKVVGKRIEEFIKKSRANGTQARNWGQRALTAVKRLGL